MADDRTFTLRQVDQARTDFAIIEDKLDDGTIRVADAKLGLAPSRFYLLIPEGGAPNPLQCLVAGPSGLLSRRTARRPRH